MNVSIALFDDFETLDVFGPVEVFGRIKDEYEVAFFSERGAMIHNHHGIHMTTKRLDLLENGTDILLIPGGPGTRVEVTNDELIKLLGTVCEKSRYVMTVCTGTALLARTGLIDGKVATSNKKAFDWVTPFGPGVLWKRQARWTVDGKYYTSSGVSAGLDMTFGFLRDRHGVEFARKIAYQMEYYWHENPEQDDFVSQPH